MINNHHQPQGSWGNIPNNHHSSHSLSIMFPFFPIIYPLFSHSLLIIWIISTIKNWTSHDFPIISSSKIYQIWISHDFLVIFPWFSHDFPAPQVAGLIIAPLWFFAQWTYSAGVASTSVTASTVISTTSVVWTLLGSILFLKENVTVPWQNDE